jgi:hypothetical protein
MHLRAFSCLQVIAPAGGLKGACAELFPKRGPADQPAVS